MAAAMVGTLCGLALATLVGETFTVGGGLGGVVGAFFGALLFELQRDGVDNLDSTSALIAKSAGGFAALAVCFSVWSIATMVSPSSVSRPATATGTVRGGEALLDGLVSFLPMLLFAAILVAVVLFGVYGAWTGRVRLTWLVAAPLTILSVVGLPFGGAWLLPTTFPLLVAAVALSRVRRDDEKTALDPTSMV